MKIGAIYTRVSSEEQARDGYSLSAQLKAIKKYAQDHDIIITPEFIFSDEGISGRKAEKRPAFMEMIAQAKAKKFDVILVHKFDRFSRNREDSIVYKSMLKKECGISVISISEHLDPDDKMSIIIEAFLEAMAEYYSINLSGEVLKGQKEKHEKGELQTRPSFGYNVLNNELVINKEEASIVKYIFEAYAYENKTMMEITRYVNNLGTKTKNGNRFENRSIYFILNNPVYIGKLTYTPGRRKTYVYDPKNVDSIMVDGKHEAIIDISLWNDVQNRLAKNESFKKPHQHIDSNPKHWTKGLIRCKECGCTMVTQNKTKLRCNGYNKCKCSNSNTLIISEVYDLIIDTIKENISTGIIENIVPSRDRKNSTNTYEIIQNRLEKLKDKEERIKTSYQEGIDTLEEYKQNKKILETERKQLLLELDNEKKPDSDQQRKQKIIENGKKVYELLIDENISLREKNEVAHALINKVEYDPNSNTLSLYYN